MVRLRRQRAVDRDVVALAHQLLKAHQLHAELLRTFLRDERIVSQNLHVKAGELFCHRARDASEADQTDRLARCAVHGLCDCVIPFGTADHIDRLRNLPRRTQKQRHRVGADLINAVIRNVYDRNAALAGSGKIDIVYADGVADNHPAVRKILDHFAVDVRVLRDQDITVRRNFLHVRCVPVLIIFQLNIGSGENFSLNVQILIRIICNDYFKHTNLHFLIAVQKS